MTDTDNARAERTGAGGLAAAAAQPGAEPCDIAFDAMPALVIGDLPPDDRAWVAEHASGCRWCAGQLAGFERLDDTLEACCPPALAPPPVDLPVRPLRTRRERPGSRLERPVAWWTTMPSPIGELVLAATARGLCELTFAAFRPEQEIAALLDHRGMAYRRLDGDAPDGAREAIDEAVRQLRQYFAGERTRFDVPIDLRGVTPFTRAVLDAAADVPFGRLDTYRGLAARIGKPGASRAVGNALGRNPLPVIVPCHRIVATGGGLGGYTGGLEIKQRLLRIEGSLLGA